MWFHYALHSCTYALKYGLNHVYVLCMHISGSCCYFIKLVHYVFMGSHLVPYVVDDFVHLLSCLVLVV